MLKKTTIEGTMIFPLKNKAHRLYKTRFVLAAAKYDQGKSIHYAQWQAKIQPGSTFKTLFTTSAAIDSRKIHHDKQKQSADTPVCVSHKERTALRLHSRRNFKGRMGKATWQLWYGPRSLNERTVTQKCLTA